MLPLLFTFALGQGSPNSINAYDDYAHAERILGEPLAFYLVNWRSGDVPPKGFAFSFPVATEPVFGATPTNLQVQSEALRRFGQALKIVEQGNTKPFSDPWVGGDSDERRMVPRSTSMAGLAASVYSSEGRTDLATRTLLNQLVFSDNSSRGDFFTNVVGQQAGWMTINAFEPLIPRMTAMDAESLRVTVKEILGRPVAALCTFDPRNFQSEYKSVVESANGDENPLRGYGRERKPNIDQSRLDDEFRKMNSVAKRQLIRTVTRRLNDQFRRVAQILNGPEREWMIRLPNPDSDTINRDSLVSFLVDALSKLPDICVEQTILTRTKLRLLDQYAAAVSYRWQYGRWPERVVGIDPLNGQPYRYEVCDDGTIRISSEGTAETGEIVLWENPDSRPKRLSDGPSDPRAEVRNYLPPRSR